MSLKSDCRVASRSSYNTVRTIAGIVSREGHVARRVAGNSEVRMTVEVLSSQCQPVVINLSLRIDRVVDGA